MNTEPRIVESPALELAGMRINVTPMSPEIPQLWMRFAPRMGTIPAIAEPHVSYGLMDAFDPATGRFDYMAAVPVAGAVALPEGMVARQVPASTYAVFASSLATLGQTFGHIFGAWLAGAAFEQVPGAPHFERYGESFNPQDPNSLVEIYIPVRPRTTMPGS